MSIEESPARRQRRRRARRRQEQSWAAKSGQVSVYRQELELDEQYRRAVELNDARDDRRESA